MDIPRQVNFTRFASASWWEDSMGGCISAVTIDMTRHGARPLGGKSSPNTLPRVLCAL